MKINFPSQLLLFILSFISITIAHADKAKFIYIYGAGVESMEYVNHYNANTQLITSVSPLATSSQLAITIQGTFKYSEWEAEAFNNTYSENNRLGIGTMANAPSATDIYISGTLKINGHQIRPDIALAHEYKNHDWWLGGVSRFGGENIEFKLSDIDGNYYCLKQNGTNYQVTVYTNDACSNESYAANWQFVGNANFVQAYGKNMSFTLGPNDQPIVAYTTNDSTHGIKVLMYDNNSGSWAPVNNDAMNPKGYVSIGDAYYPSVKYLNSNGYSMIYVAYQDACTNCVNAYKKKSTSVAGYYLPPGFGRWAPVGNYQFSGGDLTYEDYSITDPMNTDVKLAFNGDTPYVTFNLITNNPKVSCTHIGVFNFKSLYEGCIYVMKYNTKNNIWEQYSNLVDKGDGFRISDFIFDGNGSAFISYIPLIGEQQTYSSPMLSENGSGKSWETAHKVTTNLASYSSLAVDSLKHAWVAYQDIRENVITLSEFINNKKDANKGNWVTYPNPIPEINATNSYVSLAFDNYQGSPFFNLPIVAFIDSSNSNRPTVKYFNNNLWYNIGNPGFPYTDGNYKNTQLAVGEHALFVAFEDQNGNISVMKYSK